MVRRVLIMNFTDIYTREPFAQNPQFQWLDCRSIPGTTCYCDPEAQETLRRIMDPHGPEGIHFIDSGNFHYVSKFWTDKIRRPFSLILFDHHPDMQPPLFEGLLSCGSWVKEMLDTNPFLKKVCLVGTSEKQILGIDPSYRERLIFYSEQSLNHKESWTRFTQMHLQEPVYVSVDKDVLNPHDAATNWDQGSLSLTELEWLLSVILQHEAVIGVDICGECAATLNVLDARKGDSLNDHANQVLLRWILNFQDPSQN